MVSENERSRDIRAITGAYCSRVKKSLKEIRAEIRSKNSRGSLRDRILELAPYEHSEINGAFRCDLWINNYPRAAQDHWYQPQPSTMNNNDNPGNAKKGSMPNELPPMFTGGENAPGANVLGGVAGNYGSHQSQNVHAYPFVNQEYLPPQMYGGYNRGSLMPSSHGLPMVPRCSSSSQFRYHQIEQEAHNSNETQELRQAQPVAVPPSPVAQSANDIAGILQVMQLNHAHQLEQNAHQRDQNQTLLAATQANTEASRENTVAIGNLSRNVDQLATSSQAALDTAQAASTTAQAASDTAQAALAATQAQAATVGTIRRNALANTSAIVSVDSRVNGLDNRQQVLENNQMQDHETLQDVTSEVVDLTHRQELQGYRQQELINDQREDRERNNASQAQQRQTNEEQHQTNEEIKHRLTMLEMMNNQQSAAPSAFGPNGSSQATAPVAQANATRTPYVFNAGSQTASAAPAFGANGSSQATAPVAQANAPRATFVASASKKPPRVPTPSRRAKSPPPSTPSREAPPVTVRRSPRLTPKTTDLKKEHSFQPWMSRDQETNERE